MKAPNNIRSFGELQQLFNSYLKTESFDGNPAELYEPFRYILGLGGKRIRPVLTLMACEMFGTPAEKALPQAVAIELFHNFTLIHDDIMDKAPMRRNHDTVHKKFGTNTAILSGDVMLVYAYKYLSDADLTLVPALIDLFNECAVKVCEGQQLDMNFETTNDLEVDHYLKMISLKTATLLATSLKLGALVAKAPEGDASHLYEFGRQLGIAFQLKDDCLDAFGSGNKLGKQVGGDIIQNKKTFLFLSAMKEADNDHKQKLLHWYSVKEFDLSKKTEEVLSIFKQLGIATLTEQEMGYQFRQSIKHLDSISIPDSDKLEIRKIADMLMERQS